MGEAPSLERLQSGNKDTGKLTLCRVSLTALSRFWAWLRHCDGSGPAGAGPAEVAGRFLAKLRWCRRARVAARRRPGRGWLRLSA